MGKNEVQFNFGIFTHVSIDLTLTLDRNINNYIRPAGSTRFHWVHKQNGNFLSAPKYVPWCLFSIKVFSVGTVGFRGIICWFANKKNLENIPQNQLIFFFVNLIFLYFFNLFLIS